MTGLGQYLLKVNTLVLGMLPFWSNSTDETASPSLSHVRLTPNGKESMTSKSLTLSRSQATGFQISAQKADRLRAAKATQAHMKQSNQTGVLAQHSRVCRLSTMSRQYIHHAQSGLQL